MTADIVNLADLSSTNGTASVPPHGVPHRSLELVRCQDLDPARAEVHDHVPLPVALLEENASPSWTPPVPLLGQRDHALHNVGTLGRGRDRGRGVRAEDLEDSN